MTAPRDLDRNALLGRIATATDAINFRTAQTIDLHYLCAALESFIAAQESDYAARAVKQSRNRLGLVGGAK